MDAGALGPVHDAGEGLDHRRRLEGQRLPEGMGEVGPHGHVLSKTPGQPTASAGDE